MNPNDDAREILENAESAGALAKRARPHTWIPVLTLGLVIAFATPLYKQVSMSEWGTVTRRLHILVGYSHLEHPGAAAIYWLAALPLAYATIAIYLVKRGRKQGIAINTSGIALGGFLSSLVLFTGAFLVPGWIQQAVPGNLIGRGLIPLVFISFAVAAWGLLLRRVDVFLVGCVALLASLISNLYNLENPILAAGISLPFEYRLMINVAFTAIVMLAGAALLAWNERRR